MPDYDTVLEIVAEHPGVDTEELREIVSDQSDDPETVIELLEQAVESEDIIEANGRYWIVRKGRYAFSEYDHETT